MSCQKLLQQMIGVTLVMLLLVGCGAPAATPLPPLTELYLCGGQNSGQWLQEKPCLGFNATVFLWAVGEEYSSRSFGYELDGDIPGGLYEIALDLAVGEGSEGELEISIAHVHEDARTVLA